MNVRSGADSRKDSFFLGKASCHDERIIVRDRDDLVDNLQM